jgi:hypothetical protein
MTNDEVGRIIDQLERAFTRQAIDDIEQGLAQEDPAFVRRIRARDRAEVVSAYSVCLLLAAGTVLLTVGLAIGSWSVWLGGILTFVASFGANAVHERTLH